ncbi:MAG: sugar porter family MFS transporter [Gammaproteobacteria bacterium]|nr:sugar porter family MFS transporter [Gammaproteobacteria bacterium]
MNSSLLSQHHHNSHNNRRTIFIITAVAALGGLLFGYDTGVIGGSQLYFTRHFDLTAGEQGWAVSSAIYGCLLGALASGYLTKAISRKYTLIIAAFLFTLSAWGSGIADSLTELVWYRILGGLGVGMASIAAPMYIAEIAPPKERGQMVSFYQLAVVIGFFVVFLVTYFIGGSNTEGLSDIAKEELHQWNLDRGWRIMFWSELVPAIGFFILLFFVPHTPRWLIMKGRMQEAKQVLARITASEEEARLEFEDIALSFSESKKHHRITLATKGIAFVLFMGIMLSIFQQITGINAILYYGAEIFANALGYGPEDALKQQLWLGGVNLTFTFVAIFTIDKWGRKPLFITGTIGMFLGLSVLALTIYSQQMGIVSLIAILVFIGSFALSMGPVVWVMLAEIFPNSIRSIAMSIAVAAQWLFNAIVANSFPLVNASTLNHDSFNGALPYITFAVFCLVALVFVWKLVPETKGKTLEEMESMWTGEQVFHSADEVEPAR